MPIYNYRCECGHGFEDTASLAHYNEPKTCSECGALAPRVIEQAPGVIFAGDGWVSKNLRINGQMRRKNERLLKKERDLKNDGFSPRLSPNVGGELVDSWSEAQRLAKSKGNDADTYEPMIRREKIEKTKGIA